MDINKERVELIAEIELFKTEAMKMHFVQTWAETYKTDPFGHTVDDVCEVFWLKAQAYQLWEFWKAAKQQATPEGFVLVPKENISCYWQDNDEPENFCSNESDFDCLGDCIDLCEIMEINKFTQAHVNKEILFGTWFAEAIDPSEKANFFVGTHAECLEIVAKNKAVIEAQEQSYD